MAVSVQITLIICVTLVSFLGLIILAGRNKK